MTTQPPGRDAYLAELRKWTMDEYVKMLRLDDIHDARIREYLKASDLTTWSHLARVAVNVRNMKSGFLLNKTTNITICFKATLHNIGEAPVSSIYAFLYADCIDGVFTPQYVCNGPTFQSQDGEYRNGFVLWPQVDMLFTGYASVYSRVEELITTKMSENRLSFDADFYYPIGCTVDKSIVEDFVNNSRVAIRLHVIGWLRIAHRENRQVTENHINPAHRHIFTQPEDLALSASILDSVGFMAYNTIVSRTMVHVFKFGAMHVNSSDLIVGQKIVPMTAPEVTSTGDIRFHIWREIYITNKVSNLGLNVISPSFPFINNWFYIQNAHGGLFDNMAMHNKYVKSELVVGITDRLKDLDGSNYIDRDRGGGYIDGRFGQLSRYINRSILYADNTIKITDLAMCVTSEFVGRTLRDIPSVIVSDIKHGNAEAVNNRMFSDIGLFTGHIFSYMYAFFCMNSKVGIIHGDLHTNNATIMRTRQMTRVQAPKLHTAYVVGPDTWALPHTGRYSMIIDFSRSIIGDYDMVARDFSPQFAERFFEPQAMHLIQTAHHNFPQLIEKYKAQIIQQLRVNFPLMFKIATVIDAYVLMSNISEMLTMDAVFRDGRLKVAPGAIDLVDAIADHAESLFESNIRACIDGSISSVADIEWPNHVIIKKHFAAYKLDPNVLPTDITVIDVFNANNPMDYDVTDYDNWGPLLTIDRIHQFRQAHNQPIDYDMRRWLDWRIFNDDDSIETIIDKYKRHERDLMEFST